ncbi:uncharacterized protein LOC123918190 [Trifolium pratense]|uniref:uncharacterized protein LOC123918190 n=1 Tax=Trifolium pratense TaxID=57577 RepID=UPI001E697045|nr:uncharacterized protein LOC123918190 [Trifolium pratense]XP_045826122.1 uncharacterized protein LOC123918190 [Trifolium pratense]
MTHPNPNFSVSSSYHHLHHLMYPSLHHHFMFTNTFHITTNQKQRYAAGVVVSFSLSNNSQRQIKPKPPARDRVIDFGKYKGNMLGTLPSNYLKWVSKNFIARDFEDWAKLADEVLADPVYKDRIEWEFAYNLLSGDKASYASVVARSGSVAVELQEISERFGWDNDDKLGWSKIDFKRLGTSYGGRIPRIGNRKSSDADAHAKTNQKPSAAAATTSNSSSRSKRMERRERQKMRLRSSAHEETQQEQEKEDMVGDTEQVKDDDSVVGSRFPGRQALLRKAINRRKIP